MRVHGPRKFCFLWIALLQEKSCPLPPVRQAQELDDVLLWGGAFPSFQNEHTDQDWAANTPVTVLWMVGHGRASALLGYTPPFLWSHGMWDLSSPTSNRTRAPPPDPAQHWKLSLNHWTAKEVPITHFLNKQHMTRLQSENVKVFVSLWWKLLEDDPTQDSERQEDAVSYPLWKSCSQSSGGKWPCEQGTGATREHHDGNVALLWGHKWDGPPHSSAIPFSSSHIPDQALYWNSLPSSFPSCSPWRKGSFNPAYLETKFSTMLITLWALELFQTLPASLPTFALLELAGFCSTFRHRPTGL